MTEDEMVGWHHWLNGLEFEQALGVGDGQGRLGCCSPWGHKESDTTEQLSWYWSSFSPVWLLVTVWTGGLPGSLSMGFSRQECWRVAVSSLDFILHNFKPPLFKLFFFSLDIFQIGLLRPCLYSFKSYQLVHSKKSTERKRERERKEGRNMIP